MGLIRKSLAVMSLGVVRGSSKKQRVAKGQLTELKKLTAAIDREEAGERALQRSRELQAAKRAREAGTKAPALPPGWYPDHASPGLKRWWDGKQWTEHTIPARYV